jgi:hypothetical protein
MASVYGEKGGQRVTDEHWLRDAGAKGWVVLMKDDAIRRRPAERYALVRAGVRAFCLTNAQLRAAEQTERFLNNAIASSARRGSRGHTSTASTSAGFDGCGRAISGRARRRSEPSGMEAPWKPHSPRSDLQTIRSSARNPVFTGDTSIRPAADPRRWRFARRRSPVRSRLAPSEKAPQTAGFSFAVGVCMGRFKPRFPHIFPHAGAFPVVSSATATVELLPVPLTGLALPPGPRCHRTGPGGGCPSQADQEQDIR